MAIQVVFEAVDKAALATLQKVAKGVDGVTEAQKRNKNETGTAAEVWKNLTSNLTVANLATSAIQTGIRLVTDTIKSSISETVKYADQVRNLQMVSGQTAEESSRMIQVFDDFKINIDSLTPAIRKMTSEGLQPNLTTIAALSDEYNSLATPLEKNAFLMDKFGRAGLDMAEMMSKGGDAIRAMSADVDASLIMTQQGVDAAREYQLALDDWNDSVMALKVSIGNSLLPVLTKLSDNVMATAEANKRMEGELGANTPQWTEKRNAIAAEIMKEMEAERAIKATNAALDEQKSALESVNNTTLNFDNLERVNFILDFQAQTDNLDKAREEIKAKMAAIEEEIRAARESGDTQAIPGLQEDFANLVGELQSSEEAFKKWQKQAVFSMIQTKLAADGLTDAEFGQLLGIGQDMGLLDEGVVAQAQGLMDTLSGVDTGSLEQAVSDVQYLISQDGRTIKIYVEQTVTDVPTGGTMPTTGMASTSSGGDTFINYGPQYFYGTTLSGILAEWR